MPINETITRLVDETRNLAGLPDERVAELEAAIEAVSELSFELKQALDNATTEAAEVETRRNTELSGLTDGQLRARANAIAAELNARGLPPAPRGQGQGRGRG